MKQYIVMSTGAKTSDEITNFVNNSAHGYPGGRIVSVWTLGYTTYCCVEYDA